MTRPSYQAHFWPEDEFYVIEVDDCNDAADPLPVDHATQVPRAQPEQAEWMVRDMIATLLEVDTDTFDVELEAGYPVYLMVGAEAERRIGWVEHKDPALLANFLRTIAFHLDEEAAQAQHATTEETP